MMNLILLLVLSSFHFSLYRVGDARSLSSAQSSDFQLDLDLLAPFSATEHEEFFHMTISDNGEVFVASQHSLYRLSANLSYLTLTRLITDGSILGYLNNTRATGLSLTKGGQYVVVCFNTGVCNTYDVNSLHTVTTESRVTGGTGSLVAMFPGEAEDSVNIGTTSNREMVQRNVMAIGQFSVTGGHFVTDRSRWYSIVPSVLKSRIFRTGFVFSGYIYYVVEDGMEIRIIRLCDQMAEGSTSNSFRALYEIELVCGGPALYAAASVVKLVISSSSTLVLTVQLPQSSGTSRVCTYSISDINTAMDSSLAACAAGEDRRVIWNVKPLPLNIATLCSEHYSVSNHMHVPYNFMLQFIVDMQSLSSLPS